MASEPDLRVVIEGGEVAVYSQVLLRASPVFREMLQTSMVEGVSNQMWLAGKSKAEFEVFWSVLAWETAVTEENAIFLSRWANEYEIKGLKKWCESCIMLMPITCAALNHAVLHNLAEREAQCVSAISVDIRPHLNELQEMGSEMSPAAMEKLWPSICKAASVHVPFPEGFNAGHAFWPFVLRACHSVPCEQATPWPEQLHAGPASVEQPGILHESNLGVPEC